LLRMKVDERIREMFAEPELAKAFDYRSTRRAGDGDIFDYCPRVNEPFGKLLLSVLV